MTDEMLAEIEQRANAATPGEWCSPLLCRVMAIGVGADDDTSTDVARTERYADADFIAAARSDVPALVAALREARAILTDARRYLERDDCISATAGRLVERIDAALRGES